MDEPPPVRRSFVDLGHLHPIDEPSSQRRNHHAPTRARRESGASGASGASRHIPLNTMELELRARAQQTTARRDSYELLSSVERRHHGRVDSVNRLQEEESTSDDESSEGASCTPSHLRSQKRSRRMREDGNEDVDANATGDDDNNSNQSMAARYNRRCANDDALFGDEHAIDSILSRNQRINRKCVRSVIMQNAPLHPLHTTEAERSFFDVAGVQCVGCTLNTRIASDIDQFVDANYARKQPAALWRLVESYYERKWCARSRREGVVPPRWSAIDIQMHYEHHVVSSRQSRVDMCRSLRAVRHLLLERIVKQDEDEDGNEIFEADRTALDGYLKVVTAESREHDKLKELDSTVGRGTKGANGSALVPMNTRDEARDEHV